MLFLGDALFHGNVGRTDTQDGSRPDLVMSV
jgi:hypothetical protein